MDKSCARDWTLTCSAGGRSPRCACVASGSRHGPDRSPRPHHAADHAASDYRQTGHPDAVRRSVASRPDRLAYWPRRVVKTAPAQLQQLRLPGERQLVPAVDHRCALSRPALLSAPAKKSFSSVSSPIFACRTFRSTVGAASGWAASEPNRLTAPSGSRAFQLVIWLGWMSNCWAIPATLFWPLPAARATFALKAGV